jgi:hypothetical protein
VRVGPPSARDAGEVTKKDGPCVMVRADGIFPVEVVRSVRRRVDRLVAITFEAMLD